MSVGAETQVRGENWYLVLSGDHQMMGLVVENQMGEAVRHRMYISLFAAVLEFSMLENHPFVEERVVGEENQ